MKRMKFGLGMLLCSLALPVSTFAAPSVITHSVLNGGTNTITGATTNTYRGSGTVFDTRSGPFTFQLESTTTNANKIKSGDGPTVTFDACVNGSQGDVWLTNALIVVVANSGQAANGAVVLVTNITPALPQFYYPQYRLGEIWNTNAITPATTNYTGLKLRVLPRL
jgi:hypothetical protein